MNDLDVFCPQLHPNLSQGQLAKPIKKKYKGNSAKANTACPALLLVMGQLSGVGEDDQAKAIEAIEQLLTSQVLHGLLEDPH